MFGYDARKVIWENYCAVMRHLHGEVTLARLASDAGFGPATATRLEVGETRFRIDQVEKMAKAARLEPWQLWIKGLRPDALPELFDPWPFKGIKRSRFDNLTLEQKLEIQGIVRQRIERFEEGDPKEGGGDIRGNGTDG